MKSPPHEPAPLAEPGRPLWQRTLVAGVVYWLLSLVSWRLIIHPDLIAIFWPPSGWAMAVLARASIREWRWLVPALFAADLVAEWQAGYPPITGLAYAAINQGEAVIGATLLRRLVTHPLHIERVAHLLALLVAGTLACLASAILGAMVTVSLGASYTYLGVFYVWWISALLGVLVVTPLVLAGARLARQPLPRARHLAEAILLFLGAGATTWFLFSREPAESPVALSLLYAPFPFLIWAALRFQVAGAAAISLLLTTLAVACTARGEGPMMLIDATMAQRVIWLQAYLAVATFSALALAAGISERGQAREALRAHERRTRAILDQSSQFVGLCRPDGILVEANETALRFAGVSLDSVVGRPIWETPWWNHSAAEQQRLRDAVAQVAAGELVRYETTHRATDGAMHTIDFSLKPIRDEDGRILWLIPEGRDITSRKRSEETHEVLRELAHELTAPLHIKELGAVVARCCRKVFACDAFLIYAVDLKTGQHRAVHAEDTPEGGTAAVEITINFQTNTSTLLRSVAEGKQRLINREVEEENPPGVGWGFKARRSRSLMFVPVQWEGNCVGILTVQSYTPGKYNQADLDLLQTIANQCGAASMRVQAEEALLRLNTELDERVRHRTADLEAALKELESFSYSVSHDLRAPLRHVSGFASMLMANPALKDAPNATRQLASIVDSAKRMGTLIDDLLLFSRMGRAEMRLDPVNLDALVAQVRHELRDAAGDRPIDWRIGSLPAIQGDSAMLRLVWQNLLHNALKYTRHTTRPIIEIGTTPGAGEHIFFVRDNGAGFDMQYVEKLFGVFQRLHRDDEFEGTGIGLANVRRIIHRHGGRTWAEGVPGQGATFFISLPFIATPPLLKDPVGRAPLPNPPTNQNQT